MTADVTDTDVTDADGSTVAVLGLGAMGASMATRLLERGVRVVVWNRTPARSAALVDQGAKAGATPAEAARTADVVLVMVSDDDALREVILGPGGVRSSGWGGPLAITSTVSPATILALRHGDELIADVGIIGNNAHAATGGLRALVGGDAVAYAAVEPVLSLLAKQVRHVGKLGDGMRLKLVLNLLMGLEMQSLAEVISLGASLGLSERTVVETVSNSGFCAPVMAFKAGRMVARHFEEPDFRLGLMAKDLSLAAQLATDGGLELALTRAAGQTHRSLAEAGWADHDCAAIAVATALPDAGGRS